MTTTDMFKSGIALAGISNLISYHGACDPRMRYESPSTHGFGLADLCERVFHLGGPPWTDADRYIRNRSFPRIG
ncbi:hypothetical protein [Variovorax sp. 22077]|uniref:hypothetical protein n=1 Tax=Variovorax sp. 22077 TaxID=3453867 RepID=UPI003F86CE09